MVASTFFHELGHNIELRHGAWQEAPGRPVLPAPNCVPTYLSSMNYLYQLRGLLDDSGKPHLDFSSGSGTSLTEAGVSDGEFSFKYRVGWYAPWRAVTLPIRIQRIPPGPSLGPAWPVDIVTAR